MVSHFALLTWKNVFISQTPMNLQAILLVPLVAVSPHLPRMEIWYPSQIIIKEGKGIMPDVNSMYGRLRIVHYWFY
jgi:hypothetical protein